MDRASIDGHFRTLAAEIWDEIDESSKEGESAGSAVAEVLAALREVLSEVSTSSKGMTEAQKSQAQGMAQVLGEVVSIIAKGQSDMVAAMENLGQRVDGLGKALTAPKRIVTDREGRPIGVETIEG